MSQYKRSIFIFRRDLRLSDNTGLLQALESSDKVLPCFIFDPRQINDNPYRSDFLIQFMLESLEDLNQQLKKHNGKLYLFFDDPQKILKRLIKEHKIEAVFTNRDYTPFSISRDLNLKHICEQSNVQWCQYGDLLLNEPEDIKKKDGGVYTVYTPFMRTAIEIPVKEPKQNRCDRYYSSSINSESKDVYKTILKKRIDNVFGRGGRAEGLKILQSIKKFNDYDKTRDIPSIDGTTGLSAHHKFGTVSIREVFHKIKSTFGINHTLIRELYWRDFFTHIGFHYPQVLGSAFYEKYNGIKWKNNKKFFNAWCEGKTGFPIVDAGMRQLNKEGFMHNRVRMITASFLVKDLHIDWQWGEKYFAQRLVDYDPLVNNGNWQWAASTGCDAQPYFRIFNPWRQQQKFDPDCKYIKQWVPELSECDPKDIHDLEKGPNLMAGEYPQPIVDHKLQSKAIKEIYKQRN